MRISDWSSDVCSSDLLGMLIAGRVLLGLCGGPIMPLSQMLLLRIFPPEKATLATVIWAMTTLVGPVAGPILGGILCDGVGWRWLFLIKRPVAAACGLSVLSFLRGPPPPTPPAITDQLRHHPSIRIVRPLPLTLHDPPPPH